MAIELVQQPIPPHKLLQPISSRVTKVIKSLRLIPATHSRTKSRSFRSICITKVAEQNSELDGDNKDKRTLTQIKTELLQAVQGINRGTFGVPSAKKSEIEALVELLESQNPTTDPTLNLDKVGGNWKLVYSTITILGSKRTKLGLRDFITLGDFFQSIDVAKGKAVNVIKFNVRGLNLLNGQLTIEASFKNASKSVKASRVNIAYENSRITPEQLMNMFRKNYDLLLEIFNPEGWLEISYVDNTMRIGRDDKGNIFVLERPSAAENMA